MYTITFEDDGTIIDASVYDLLVYFDCDCSYIPPITDTILANQYSSRNANELVEASTQLACSLLTSLAASEIL